MSSAFALFQCHLVRTFSDVAGRGWGEGGRWKKNVAIFTFQVTVDWEQSLFPLKGSKAKRTQELVTAKIASGVRHVSTRQVIFTLAGVLFSLYYP